MEALFRKLFTGKLKGILSAWGELDEKAINFSEGLTLEGLTLKSRDLPGIGLRVKGGFIKQLSVKVPWKRLKKESVRVEVKELFVILGPRAVTGLHVALPPHARSKVPVQTSLCQYHS
jgi:hypothetical protein